MRGCLPDRVGALTFFKGYGISSFRTVRKIVTCHGLSWHTLVTLLYTTPDYSITYIYYTVLRVKRKFKTSLWMSQNIINILPPWDVPVMCLQCLAVVRKWVHLSDDPVTCLHCLALLHKWVHLVFSEQFSYMTNAIANGTQYKVMQQSLTLSAANDSSGSVR